MPGAASPRRAARLRCRRGVRGASRWQHVAVRLRLPSLCARVLAEPTLRHNAARRRRTGRERGCGACRGRCVDCHLRLRELNASDARLLCFEAAFAEGNVHDLMPLFYSRLFPCRDMFRRAALRGHFAAPVRSQQRSLAALKPARHGAHSWLSYGHDSKLPQADAGFFQVRTGCCKCNAALLCCHRPHPLLRAAPRVLLHAGERHLCALPVVQG